MRLPLLFLSFILSLSVTAQLITGPRAASIVPDAQVLRYDDNQSLPQFIRLQAGLTHPMEGASDFLRGRLQLPEDHDFVLIGSETDQYGIEHRRYRQTVKGYPVIGGVYLFHGKDGRWTEANGELFLPDAATATVLVEPDAALAKIMQDRPAEVYGWEPERPISDYPTPKLCWVPMDLNFSPGQFRLAYEIHLYRLRPHSHERLFIDAFSGELIAVENQIQAFHVHQTDVPGQAKTRYSGLRDIQTTFQGDTTYVLQETGRGQGIFTYNSERQTAYPYTNFEDEDNYWENVNAQRDEVATDCHWGAEMYYDLLRNFLGRNSIDDQGEPLESHVHYGQGFANAFWDGRRSTFGDGAAGSSIDLPSVTLDVVAHEFTHGLTDRTSDLIYRDEFGALNESFSDILGAATNFTYRPDAPGWIVGADLSTDGQGIRSMQNPIAYGNPKNYRGQFWADGGIVHSNSGVQNHWFYLLTEGGNGTNEFDYTYSLPGLGLLTALEVAYRNNAFYLTETSTYSDAGFNAVLAAASAFGSCSEDLSQVIEAWRAVGVDVPTIPTDPIASFRVNGPFCDPMDSVRFTNNSFGDTYLWDFGDGTTSTEASPRHVYGSPGNYTVRLRVEGCSGDVDELVLTDAVSIDPDNIFCSFDTMPANDTLRIVNCRGVLFDSGGPNANYSNSEASMLTIENPLGEPLTLTVNRFQSQVFLDRLVILDGDTSSTTELAVLSGSILNRVIRSSSPVVTLKFASNFSTSDDGWEITWGDNPSNSAPDASFSVDNTTPMLHQPITFNASGIIPGPITYDFGDGTVPVLVDGPITHIYNQAGNYTVRAVDQNCSAADTVTQTITVAEGTQMAFGINGISDTLEVGAFAVHRIPVQNVGDQDGFLQLNLPSFEELSYQSALNFSLSNRSTAHRLAGFPELLPDPALTIRVDGDFDVPGKIATVTVEGEVVGQVGGSTDPRSQTLTITPTAEELGSWLADGGIDVVVTSSNQVSTLSFANLHEVTFTHGQVSYLTGIEELQAIPAGNTLEARVFFDASELIPGLYLDTVHVRTNLVDSALTSIPTSLLVQGVPLPDYSSNQLDFGFFLPDATGTQNLLIRNLGSADFTLDSITIDQPLFVANFTAQTLAPGDDYSLMVDFTGASNNGQQQALLTVYTSEGPQEITLLANVAGPPNATIPFGSFTETVAAFSFENKDYMVSNNSPSTPLIYEITQHLANQDNTETYTEEQDTTTHVFTNLPLANHQLQLVLQGDFSSTSERVRLFLDGENQGFVFDNNLSDNVPDTVDVNLPAEFLEDGQLTVQLVNAGSVSFDPDYANSHGVILTQTEEVNWLQRLADIPGPLAAGSSAMVPYRFDAGLLTAGNYFATLKFTSNDPDLPERLIPVEMQVTGAPVLSTSVDTIDFGGVEIGTDRSITFVYGNAGSDILNLDVFNSEDAQFVIGAFAGTLEVGDTRNQLVRFTPTVVGESQTSLRINGPGIDEKIVVLKGTGIASAELFTEIDTICATLISGSDTSFTGFPISNLGGATLRYDLGLKGGKIVVWSYEMVENTYENVLRPILEELQPAEFITLTNEQDPSLMTSILAQTDVLVIPPLRDPAPMVVAAMRAPVQSFMNRGGQLVILGGQTGEVPFQLGLFGGSALRSNPAGIPIIRTPEHPLFAGITDSLIYSVEETNFVVGNLGNDVQVLGRMFNNPCILTATRGLGGYTYLGFTYETTDANSRQIFQNAVEQGFGTFDLPEWLSITPLNGEVAPGETMDEHLFDVTLSGLGIVAGEYYYDGFIRSNDPRGTGSRPFVVKLTVLQDVATEDHPAVEDLRIYPNPSQGPVYLDLELGIRAAVRWNLTDRLGRLVTTGVLPTGSVSRQLLFNGSALPTGSYQLQLLTEQQERLAVRRLVIR